MNAAMATSTSAFRVAAVSSSVKLTKKQPFLMGTSSIDLQSKNRRRALLPRAGAGAASPIVASSSSSSEDDATEKKNGGGVDTGRLALLATVASHPVIFGCQEAMAKGGEFGLLEGRTAALVHPFFLGGLWFASVYAGYLGWQWRRVRTTGEEISTLKATMPAAAGGEAVELTAAQKATQSQIDDLAATRKELVAGGYKDKHNNVGSLLLAFGVTLAVEGGMNTYLRTGKLFPGPHLYAGMGIVCLWAAAAGLVPEMQRGNNKARNVHIALNAVNVALFTWQIPTGLEIVGKVFQFTSWP